MPYPKQDKELVTTDEMIEMKSRGVYCLLNEFDKKQLALLIENRPLTVHKTVPGVVGVWEVRCFSVQGGRTHKLKGWVGCF